MKSFNRLGRVRDSVLSAGGVGERERSLRAATVLEGVPGSLELGLEGRGQKSVSALPTLWEIHMKTI